MKFLKNLFYFLIIAAALFLGALFAVENTTAVPLNLLVFALPERSVALWSRPKEIAWRELAE